MSARNPSRRAILAGFAAAPVIAMPVAVATAPATDTRAWDAVISRWHTIVAQIDQFDRGESAWQHLRGPERERKLDRLCGEMNDAGAAVREAPPPTAFALAEKIEAIRRDMENADIDEETLVILAADARRLCQSTVVQP